MKIAVVGATGLVGTHISELLEGQGHEVRRLHRGSERFPVDLSTGSGLPEALAGVDAVVNATNEPPPSRPGPVLVEGTRRLLEASDAHHVCVSIVGIDIIGPHNGYYGAKLAQERVVTESGRPYTIIRSTQFHEFLGGFAMRLGRARVELHSRALFAPIAAAEAAAVIARRATLAPSNATLDICGPDTLTVTQLRARRGLPAPLYLGRAAGRLMRAGALVPTRPDVRGVLTYNQWLAEAQGRPWRPAPGR